MDSPSSSSTTVKVVSVICATVVLLGALGVAAFMDATSTYRSLKRGDDASTISMRGLAKELGVKSDRAVLAVYLNATGDTTEAATAALDSKRTRTQRALVDQGISEADILTDPLSISGGGMYDESMQMPTEFYASQALRVESEDAARLATIAASLEELVNERVLDYLPMPEYRFTGMEQLQERLLATATAQARAQANALVSNAGGELGDMSSIRILALTALPKGLQYFPYTPMAEVPGDMNTSVDTSTAEKDVYAEVLVTYEID